VLLAAQPAASRPRDDALAGAFRCSVIADSRQWLDCYYGAAQPVRAALNLAPALAAQVRLVSAPPAGGAPRDEAARDDVMSAAANCNHVAGDRAWLDCYYGAAQPMRAVLGLTPAPAAQASPASTPSSGSGQPSDISVRDAVMSAAASCTNVADDRQWLDCYYAAAQPLRAALHLSPAPQARPAMSIPQLAGTHPASEFDKEAVVPDAAIHRVQSRMVSYQFNALGTFTVTLENGQVWRQVDGDTDHAHWKKPASSYVVTIARGFLKSYSFQVRGLPGLYKVLRIS